MNKTPAIVIFMLILGLFLFTAGCTQEQPDNVTPPQGMNGTIPQDTYTSNETLVAFVDSAATYVKTNGKEKALAEFNNPNGSFIDGELYIYAYTFNGTTLAHPVSPEKVGLYRLDEGDTGTFLRGYIESVKNGTGFYRLNYVNPIHARPLESKLVSGGRIDDDWWLGSGIYTGPAEPSSVE